MSIFTPSRRIRQATLIIGLSLLTLILISATTPRANGSSELKTHHSSFIAHSMLFIQNVGQFPASTRFVVPGQHSRLELHDTGLTLVTADHEPLQLTFEQTNPAAELLPLDSLDTVVSYFQGDRSQWHTAVPTFNGVRYRNLYPQLDLVIQGQGDHWTWQFVCQGECQAALAQVKLKLNTAVTLKENSLEVDLGQTSVPLITVVNVDGTPYPSALPQPTVHGRTIYTPFQKANKIDSRQRLEGTSIIYSTFLGGSEDDGAFRVGLDAEGNVYIMGYTKSLSFYQWGGNHGGQTDIYVLKFNPTTNQVGYVTFIGGDGKQSFVYHSYNDDDANDMVVDAAGNVYITGGTNAADFPVTTNLTDNSGSTKVFITKINPSGSLSYSMLVSGIGNPLYTGNVSGLGIAVDKLGQAYVVGGGDISHISQIGGGYLHNFPTIPYGLFVLKVNPTGNALIYLALLHGTLRWGADIAVDDMGQAIVAGNDNDGSFAHVVTANAADRSYNGSVDPFVFKLTADGRDLVYFTYLGNSSEYDVATAVTVDSLGNAYIAGNTDSGSFNSSPITTLDYYNAYHGGADIFVAKLNPSGSQVNYLGFIGGRWYEGATDIKVDSAQQVYIAGETNSPDLLPVHLGYGGDNGFVAKINPQDLSQKLEGIRFSQLGETSAGGIALGSDNLVYVVGGTSASNFALTPNAFDKVREKNDAYLAILQIGTPPDCPLVEIVSARYLDANTIGVVGFVQPELIGTGQATLTKNGNAAVMADLDYLATHNAPSGAADERNIASHDSNEVRLRGLWSAVLHQNTAFNAQETLVAQASMPDTTPCNEQFIVTQPPANDLLETTSIATPGEVGAQVTVSGISRASAASSPVTLNLSRYVPHADNPAMHGTWEGLVSTSSWAGRWSMNIASQANQGEQLFKVSFDYNTSGGFVHMEDIDGFYGRNGADFFVRRDEANSDQKNRGQALALRDAIRSTVGGNRTYSDIYTEQLIAAMGAQEGGGDPANFDNGYTHTKTNDDGTTTITTIGLMQVTGHTYTRTVTSINQNVQDAIGVLHPFYQAAWDVSQNDTPSQNFDYIRNANNDIDPLLTAIVHYNAGPSFGCSYWLDKPEAERNYLKNIAKQLLSLTNDSNSFPPLGSSFSMAEFLADADYTTQISTLQSTLETAQPQIQARIENSMKVRGQKVCNDILHPTLTPQPN